jgi:hypothetical protein
MAVGPRMVEIKLTPIRMKQSFYDFIHAVTCYKYYAMQIIACMLLVDAAGEAEFIFISQCRSGTNKCQIGSLDHITISPTFFMFKAI